MAITAVAQWLMSVCNNRIAFEVVQRLREDAFGKLTRLPLSYIDSHAHGDTVSRIVADAEQFSDGLLMGFTQFFSGVLTIAGTLAFMFVTSWQIALVVVFVTPLSLFVAKYISSHTYSFFKKQSETRGEQTAFTEEMIANLKTVQAFSHEAENAEKFDEINRRLEKSSLDATFYSSLTNPSTRFVNNLVYALVALIGALYIASGASFSVGDLTIFLSYANQYTKPFNEISGVVTELQNALACAARIFELLGEREESSDAGAEELGEAEGNVSLDGVYFSYTPGQKLIESFSLDVHPGQKVAIVGPTGCGKTTLINLLMRFYDVTGGAVRVDGRDVREVTRKSLRSNYGMVLQETWLKSGTVKENIRMGRPDASDEEVIAAARASHADGFIRAAAAGIRYAARRGGRQPVPGAAPAAVYRPHHALSAAHAHSRRGDLLDRYPHGAENRGRFCASDGGAYLLRRGAPGCPPSGRRTSSSRWTRGGSWSRARTSSCSPRAGFIIGCITVSLNERPEFGRSETPKAPPEFPTGPSAVFFVRLSRAGSFSGGRAFFAAPPAGLFRRRSKRADKKLPRL